MKINVCVCKGKILPIISLKAADKLKICCKLKNICKKIVILHSWNFSWVYIVWVLEIFAKRGWGVGLNFSHKKGGITKKRGGCFKKGGISYFHANSFQCYFSLSVWCAFVCLVYLNHFYEFSERTQFSGRKQYSFCFTERT